MRPANRIFHVDGDSFFASCEIALNPKLEDQPVWGGGGGGATALAFPETTVKFYLRELFTKLGVQDRTEAVVSALRQGIVHLE